MINRSQPDDHRLRAPGCAVPEGLRRARTRTPHSHGPDPAHHGPDRARAVPGDRRLPPPGRHRPPLADLRAHVTANLARLPRLTHYLKGPGLRARWARDPDLDLEHRVRERRIEPGDENLDIARQELLTHPLPDDGPLWDLWLLHGHAPGRFTLCYRAHHTSHDGSGVLNTLYELFGTAPAGATALTTRAVRASRAGLGDYLRTLGGCSAPPPPMTSGTIPPGP